MKRLSKIVCYFVFAVALGTIANYFDIPIDFTVGENVRRPKQHDYEERYSDNDNDSVAEKAIKSIANKFVNNSLDFHIVNGANDIYEIAKKHKDDEKTLCTAIKELDSLMKKVDLSYNKVIISEYIKELATL